MRYILIVTDIGGNLHHVEFPIHPDDDVRTPTEIADLINKLVGDDGCRSLKIGTTILHMRNVVTISVTEGGTREQ